MKKSKKLVVGTSLLAALLILPSAVSAGFFFGGNKGQVKPAPVVKDPVVEDEAPPTPKRKAIQSQSDEEIPAPVRKKAARIQSDIEDEAPAPVRRKVTAGGVEHLGRVPAVIKGRVDAPCVEPCTLSSALSLITSPGARSSKIATQSTVRTFSLAASDKMLSVAIGRWCAESDGECRLLKWQSGMDVPLEAGARFKAETAKDAILQLFASIEQTTGHAFALNTKYNNNVWIITDKTEGAVQ